MARRLTLTVLPNRGAWGTKQRQTKARMATRESLWSLAPYAGANIRLGSFPLISGRADNATARFRRERGERLFQSKLGGS